MFLDCFKNNGKPYLRIVEGYRYKKEDGSVTIKRKTIHNIGYLEKFDDGKPDLLNRLRGQFKNKTLPIEGFDYSFGNIQNNIKITIDKDNPPKLEPKNIGYFFLESVYNNLGIDQVLRDYKSRSKIVYDLNGLTKLLVFNRILDPKSKKATFENKDKYLFDVTSSNDIKEIYRTLDVLNKKAESIQTRMNTKISQSSIGRNTDITYYDVTNYYFETMYGDDDIYKLDEEGNKILDEKGKPIILERGFRKNGVGKDGKPNPLVQMGLFIDNNGIPVSYKLFPGNTQDKTTFKDMIKTTLNNKDFGRVIVVADNGNNAQENMYLLLEQGNGYIISKSVKQSWSKISEWAKDEDGYNYISKNGEVTFKSKSRIIERVLKDKDGNTKPIKEKEIIYWSKKHYDREKHQNEKFIEYLESCKDNPDKLKDKQRKSQEFIKVIQTDKKTGEVLKTKAVVVLLEEKIQKYKETMGYYSIITSEIDMEDKEIINRYHGLARIEDSFRIIKSDLEGRPIYVWTKEHINAHFLICFIALTIIRLLQHKVLKHEGKRTLNTDGWEQGITAVKIKEALNSYNVNHLADDYYQISIITNNIIRIMESINITSDMKLPTKTEIRNFKNQINKVNI